MYNGGKHLIMLAWSLNLQPLVISSTFTGFICSHDDLVPVVFCEIHYHPFVLQKQLKEIQKTFQQRIQQREKDLQQLERLWSLIR